MEDERRCKKRGRRGLSRTSARQAFAKTVALGTDGLRRRGVWRNSGGRFSARKTVAGAYFRFAAAELAPSMTLKSYWVQKP